MNFKEKLHERAEYFARGDTMIHYAFCAGATWTLLELTMWRSIERDKSGLATDEALDEIFDSLPVLVIDNSGIIEFISDYNASEWRGDLERKPIYRWRPIK